MKRGRPRLPVGATKPRKLSVPVSKADFARLTREWKLAGAEGMADYVRQKLGCATESGAA